MTENTRAPSMQRRLRRRASLTLTGISGTYHCGVVAARIAVVEASNSFLVDQDCRIER